MKRAFCIHRFASVCGVTLFLLLPCSLLAADDEEQEGTREQVEAEDNVTLQVTDGVSKDGEKELIVFDKDKPDEEWEVGVRVKFHPKPEHEYIIQSKKYNWKVSEGFVVDDPEAARPKIRAKAEAAGTEGRLNLHLQWQEEKLDEKNKPTGETKMHPWSNDKGSMRLLVPEFELESVSYNLWDKGKTGALPLFNNDDTPTLIMPPEYIKNDERLSDNLGVLYKRNITPKMKVRFSCKPSTAGEIILLAIQEGKSLVPSAKSDEKNRLSGRSTEALVTCEEALPNMICSGSANHKWKWSVYGRELEIKDSQTGEEILSKINNVFVVFDEPRAKWQEPWINCMKYGIEALNGNKADNEFNLLKQIVPQFRSKESYPENYKSQLSYVGDRYKSHENIESLFKGSSPFVNCYDSAATIFVISQYMGSEASTVSAVQKVPWSYKNADGDWVDTMHTYNLYKSKFVFDGTPVWATEKPQNGAPQQGTLSERQFFELWKLENWKTTELGKKISDSFIW